MDKLRYGLPTSNNSSDSQCMRHVIIEYPVHLIEQLRASSPVIYHILFLKNVEAKKILRNNLTSHISIAYMSPILGTVLGHERDPISSFLIAWNRKSASSAFENAIHLARDNHEIWHR